MRCRVVLVAGVLGLCGCAQSAPAPVASVPPPASSASGSVSVAATRSASATRASATTTANAKTSAPSATASVSGFDVLPAGYTFAYLQKLTKANGRWAVVLDPVTMCLVDGPNSDPNCASIDPDTPNDYVVRNVSTRTYTVPLASGTVLRVVGPSGAPGDYVTVAMAERSWAGNEILVEYGTNVSGEVWTIQEFWHP